MPRVKLIWIEHLTLDDYDTKQVIRSIDDGEFEEITAEELQQIRTNLYQIPRPSYGLEPRLLVLDDEPIVNRLLSLRELIEKQNEAKELIAKKRKEAAAKRKKSKLEKERMQFEALKQKFER
jgi:hypothetical protein